MFDGKIKPSDVVEPSQSTLKYSTDLDNDGRPVKEDNIHGIMKIKNNPYYAFSIDIEPTGYIEFQELRVDRTGVVPKYVTADLETTRQYRVSKDVEYKMRKDTNYEIYDEVRKFEEAKEDGRNITVDELGENGEPNKEIEDEDLERTRGRR